MKKVVFPLKLQMKRSQVADLHQALTLIGIEVAEIEKENRRFGTSTRTAVRKFQTDHQLPVTGVVDESTANALNTLLAERSALDEEVTYLVKGLVLSADSKPAVGLGVQAFDRDVSREERLGAAVTDQEGFYRIIFTESQFKKTDSERGGPELFIRVSDTLGRRLGQSKTIINASRESCINWTLAAVPSLNLIVLGRVTTSDGLPAGNLILKAYDRNVGEDDTLLGQVSTDAQGNYSIVYSSDKLDGKSAADLVICLYQDGKLLQTSDVIFNARPMETRDFVIAAVQPEFPRLDKYALKLEARIKTLNAVVSETDQQKIVENELLAAKGDWAAASAVLKDKLPPELMQRLHIADSVATAVGDKPSVTAAILKGVGTMLDIANLNVDNLTRLIAPDATPESAEYQEAKAQAVAINKQSFVREPLTVLQRMTHEGEIPVADEKIRAGLGNFLQSIPAETDIRLLPIHKVLTVDALKDIPEELRAEVVVQAKALWRTMAITPPDAPHVPPVLMKANLTSAFHVGEKTESTFLNTYGGAMGKETAQQVYTSAINTRIRNEHALMTMREAVRGSGLAAIDGTKTREERSSDAKQLAEANDIQLNLDSLFADMDYCECKECQTVYSASSYFVELLNFLRNNNLGSVSFTEGSLNATNNNILHNTNKDIAFTPLGRLFRRRPDLGDLELTCENTNTVLPYIDLVNEVMERYVVYRADYDASKVKQQNVFNITDETKEELLAQPQHTNDTAYCILKNEAVYPFNLPFHQPIEAARIFLKYLGTSRYELLDAFRAAHESGELSKDAPTFEDSCDSVNQTGETSTVDDPIRAAEEAARKQKHEAAILQAQHPSDRLSAPTPERTNQPETPDPRHPGNREESLAKLHDKVLNRAVDAEFLGLTQEEYIILTKEAFWEKDYFDITQNTTFTVQQYQDKIGVKPTYEYYGYSTEASQLDTNEDPETGQTGLHFVKKEFLPRTGIQYTDLVELLKTRFINPLLPQGLTLAILENIQSSYLFLKTLVDNNSTDDVVRFAKLIDYLEKIQSWASVPQVMQAFSQDTSTNDDSSKENRIIREWVYNCFEKLGNIIVLESGEGPQLPIEGGLFKSRSDEQFAKLHSDGSIISLDGFIIGTVSTVMGFDSDGLPAVCAGPVIWEDQSFAEEVANDNVVIQNENGDVTGFVLPKGLFMSSADQEGFSVGMPWLRPTDTCNLDKVRLQHLDGSALCSGRSQLPIEGKLYAADKPFIGYLSKDGIIVDKSKTIIAHVTPSGDVIDNEGKIFANNFPPNNILVIIDDKGARVGWVSAIGLLGRNENRLSWLPPSLDEYDRIQRFIRLWRKLGWTIDEVDKALEGLATSDITPDFLHQLVDVKKLLEQTGLPLIKLLSFWADISTMGEKSLYSRLFLTHNMVRNDSVFKADEQGEYLTRSEKIIDHLPVLMAALNLKADDITAIFNQPDDLLTLQNVSEIYRNGLLAKALHIKVSDRTDLVKLFGDPFANADKTLQLFEIWRKMEEAGFTFRQLTYMINKDCDDPTKTLAPSEKMILKTVKTLFDGLNAIDSDNQDVTDVDLATTELVRAKAGQIYESPVVEKIMRLLEGTTVYITTVETTKAPIGLKDKLDKIPNPLPSWVTKLKYIDKKDLVSIQVTGLFTDEEEEAVKALFPDTDIPDWKAAIDRIRMQSLAFFNDAIVGLFTDEGKDAKANEPAIEDATTNLLTGDIIVTLDQIAPLAFSVGDLLDPPSFISKLKQPRADVMSVYIKGRLLYATPTVLDGWPDSGTVSGSIQKAVIKDLNAIIQGELIFDKARFNGIALRPETSQLLTAKDLQGNDLLRLNQLLLEDAYPLDLSKDSNSAPKKRLFFLRYFLPFLRKRLERRFITDTMSAAFGLPGDVTNVLLSEVLTTTDVPTCTAMSVLETVRSSRLQPAQGWKGYLIPPTDDNYAFVASVPNQKGTRVKIIPAVSPLAPLVISGIADALEFKNPKAAPINVWSTDPVPLKAGMLYPLIMADHDASQLMWRTTVLPATKIPTSALLPLDAIAGTSDVFIKFSKAALVVKGFNLSREEVRHFNDHGVKFGRLNFNAITLGSWCRIADYTALRDALPKTGMPLLDLFNWAYQPDGADLAGKLNDVTQWGIDRINALIKDIHFDLLLPIDFQNEANLVMMQRAIAVADKVGVDIARLFKWAQPGSKFGLCRQNAEDIRMAMRARFNAEDWEQAVKPLNDQLREMQKQALISFLLVEPDLKAWPVVDADSLFEFFLIDVQMGAARETSRMVQAIASVQLFIKRCLMGLEDKLDSNGYPIKDADGYPIGVPVDAIDRDRWEWMQKYRVWEANRKVFLYPENWIRPELRDDKSPFYKELESELLQKDINPQTIEEALKNYLYKVDEVANLKVVGLFLDETGNKLHVFARTRNAPYFFFYRYFDIKESNWYPWEKMQVDIPSYDVEDVDATGKETGNIKKNGNGTYLIPVVWNNRLLVFFPQFMKKTIAASSDKSISKMAESTGTDLKPSEKWEIKMAWSEYRKGKWTPKQVSADAVYFEKFPGYSPDAYVFIPTIDLDKVMIDVYHEEEKSTSTLLLQYPKLSSAEIVFSIYVSEKADGTYTTNDDGKNADTTYYVELRTQGGELITNVIEQGSGRQYTYKTDQGLPISYPVSFTIDPEKKKLTSLDCQNFIVRIVENSHGNNDVWWFSATVTLTFEDNSCLQASWAGNLNESNESDKIFLTNTPASPFSLTTSQLPQRFKFSGNHFSLTDSSGDPVQAMSLTDYHFHYKLNRLHSLQAENDALPELILNDPSCDDDNTELILPGPKKTYVFHSTNVQEVLSKLNGDKFEDLFKYYLELFNPDVPYTQTMTEVYGGYKDKGQTSYNELKQPYSLYNWELCFHAPMQLVDHLLTTQQFDQAIAMCQYVFNPQAKPDVREDILQRCWQFPPFKEINAHHVLENLFNDLKPGESNDAIEKWRKNPFQPHVVARDRPSAYMKYVAMKYIEILIAYGDYYFRQNSMESIPMAIQCYVVASHLYGPRGQKIPRRGKIGNQTYNTLLDKWDAFGNAMVEMELAFPFTNQAYVNTTSADVGLANIFGSMSTLFFGIPDNPNLTALRDTIDDRLLKIRSCENIEGIFQQLPLFEPPIDPALLVQAAAQGLSLSSVLSDMNSPMPNYRFYYLLQKALELCGELKALGNAFLSAKEKGNSEALSSMRAKHESGIHNLVMEVRKQQLDEATKSLEALQQNRLGPESRMKYYLSLVGEELSKVPDDKADFSDLPNQIEKPVDEGGLKLIKYEKEEMDKAEAARDLQIAVGVVETLSSILHIIPNISTDAKPMGIGAGTWWGGANLGNAAQAVARGLQIGVNELSYQSSSAARKGGFLRQLQDRVQQANSAGYEIKNIDKQILTQQIRIDIANKEITNQQKQIDNAQEVEEYLRNKYTNEELYSWMEGEIRTLYNQTYRLTYDLAKKVEKTYRFERGLSESNFVQYGYWDAGRDGLLSGERLHLALKQLEAAYQEKRGYDFEVTKHVSLRQIDPQALLTLRETGTCDFALPEVLFDMDYPGHYMRRIKSVALTVPCVVGPYTSLNCTLRLVEHKFRTKAIVSPGYAETTDETDERFSTVNVPITSIAVSSGQSDSGVFELNFKDERYIPFEGAGAISKWRIELSKEFRQFDYGTISDVVMHMRYTAVDGGNNLQGSAAGYVTKFIKNLIEWSNDEGLFAMIDLKRDFSGEWYKALDPANTERKMNLATLSDHLPGFVKYSRIGGAVTGSNVTVVNINLFSSKVISKPTIIGIDFVPQQGQYREFAASCECSLESWEITIPSEVAANDEIYLIIRYKLT